MALMSLWLLLLLLRLKHKSHRQDRDWDVGRGWKRVTRLRCAEGRSRPLSEGRRSRAAARCGAHMHAHDACWPRGGYRCVRRWQKAVVKALLAEGVTGQCACTDATQGRVMLQSYDGPTGWHVSNAYGSLTEGTKKVTGAGGEQLVRACRGPESGAVKTCLRLVEAVTSACGTVCVVNDCCSDTRTMQAWG